MFFSPRKKTSSLRVCSRSVLSKPCTQEFNLGIGANYLGCSPPKVVVAKFCTKKPFYFFRVSEAIKLDLGPLLSRSMIDR